MAIAIAELVKSLSVDQLRPLVGGHLLELVSLVDPRLIESNAIRSVLLRDDGGRGLIAIRFFFVILYFQPNRIQINRGD